MQKNFIVYKSSAGSGKTFTLVKEYLKIALNDSSIKPHLYKKILAITFTNKAAAEMKYRILDALKNISENNTKGIELAGILSKELNIPAHELNQRASILLSEILHNYSDFAISTIDSFTHKIVKTFAYDLKLPVNFNIETNTADFYQKVISGLIAKVGQNPELTDLLVKYVTSNAEDNNGWDPESKLTEFSSLMQKEDAELNLDKLKKLNTQELKAFQKEINEFIQAFKAVLKEAGIKAVRIIEENHLTDNNFTYSKTGPQRIFYKWKNVTNEKHSDLISKRTLEAIAKNKWANNANTKEENLKIEAIAPILSEIASDTFNYINENGKYYNLYSLIEKNIYSIILVNELKLISEEFKAEEQIVFISEFNSKISNIVSEEPAPFIYERLGDRYQHYLLDEFQDTSTLQWMNLLPLIDNSLGMGKFNLIVGDGKQSIYRWRNANVQQFNILPDIQNPQNNSVIEERKESLERNYGLEILNTNYRSLKEVVNFNNSFFDFLPNIILSEQFSSIYHNQAQEIKKNQGGYVSLQYGKIEKEALDELTYSNITQYITNALSHGFEYRDICIIVRNNNSGNKIANYLIEQSIPVISSDSLLLKNNPEINCIVNFLKHLNNPSDLISAASVLNYCFINNDAYQRIYDALFQSKSLIHALNKFGLTVSNEAFYQKNVFDVCVYIISLLKLETKNPQYLRFFLDEVNDYLVNKTGSINDFIIWWEKRKNQASLIIPEGVNAVKIMTIHKSKGLEFPIVILPFFNWETYTSTNAWVDLEKFKTQLPIGVLNITKSISDAGLEDVYELEKNEQYLDNLNLIYVAFTRAVERLHIVCYKSKTYRKETISDWIENYIENCTNTTKEGFLEFGKLERKSSESHTVALKSFDISELKINNNSDLIKIKGSHKLKTSEESGIAIEYGIKMHYILSEIGSVNDINPVLNKMIDTGIITSGEKESLINKIESFVNHPLISKYYLGNYKYKNESELITETGELLRPDKVIYSQDEVVIIDYKTGQPDLRKHSAQMKKYSDALLKMGASKIKSILVYLDENKIELVN